MQALLYNIGFAKTYPQMGRYTFEEKMEYWAFVWGAAVMGMTGFLMWNPITATQYLPGEFVPAAKAAHGGEAVLAVLAIIIWHMYGVHIKRFNKAMFTGMQTEAGNAPRTSSRTCGYQSRASQTDDPTPQLFANAR